jgi:uncharacterized membrane protein YdcZ (DUF606 family)
VLSVAVAIQMGHRLHASRNSRAQLPRTSTDQPALLSEQSSSSTDLSPLEVPNSPAPPPRDQQSVAPSVDVATTDGSVSGPTLLRLWGWSPRPAWPMLLPGALGAVVVATATVVTPIIGYALYSIAVVAGQLATSSAIDALGVVNGSWAHRAPKPLSLLRIASLLITLVGCCITVAEFFVPGQFVSDYSGPVLLSCFVVTTLTAGLLPVQAVLNRAASSRLPSRVQVVWWSFSEGLLLLSIVVTLVLAFATPAAVRDGLPSKVATMPWWMFTGPSRSRIYHRSGMMAACSIARH